MDRFEAGGLGEQPRVGVLLEPYDPAVLEVPDVGDLRGQRPTGRTRRAAVATEHDDRGPAVEQTVDVDLPVGEDPWDTGKQAVDDRVRADPGVARPEGDVLSLVPFDPFVEVRDRGRDVGAGECVVDRTNDGGVLRQCRAPDWLGYDASSRRVVSSMGFRTQ